MAIGDEFKGSAGTRSGGRRRRGGNPIPTAPTGPAPTSGTLPSTLPGGGGGGKTDDRKKKADVPGDGGASAAEKRAIARANEEKEAAADRYRKQAENLEAQAAALKFALSKTYKKSLRQNLKDVGDVLKDQQSLLRRGYRERVGQLGESVEDNEKALGDQSAANNQNMVRERNMALGEVMAQGAGESDALQSMLMSLRNWSANQGEVQRAYFDTLRSVNQSLTDLTIDTRTGLANNVLQANADKEQLWQNYYDRRSESLTQLGNIRGQQADYYAMADEMDASAAKAREDARAAKLDKAPVPQNEHRKGGDQKASTSTKLQPSAEGEAAFAQSEKAFMAAAKEAGKSWDNPGVPKRIMRWDGRDEFDAVPVQSKLAQARTVELAQAPEGASLRKWG